MSDLKFDLKKFNKNFNEYDENLVKDIIKKDDDYLKSLTYKKKYFNPFDYSSNYHINYFVNNFINKLFNNELTLNDIIKDDIILFHIALLCLITSFMMYLFNKL